MGVALVEDLIREYKKSLKLLRSASSVSMEYSSMVSDTEWAIEIMETGHIPGTKWTVARWNRNKREIPVDPLIMSRYVRNQVPVGAAPKWMVEFLEKLMKSLTPLERDAFELVRGRGYSFSQAGKLLGCSKASAQSYIKRAEKKIQLAIRKQTISKGVI
jgi:DNA-binding CsgD family transcriptional regulator